MVARAEGGAVRASVVEKRKTGTACLPPPAVPERQKNFVHKVEIVHEEKLTGLINGQLPQLNYSVDSGNESLSKDSPCSRAAQIARASAGPDCGARPSGKESMESITSGLLSSTRGREGARPRRPLTSDSDSSTTGSLQDYDQELASSEDRSSTLPRAERRIHKVVRSNPNLANGGGVGPSAGVRRSVYSASGGVMYSSTPQLCDSDTSTKHLITVVTQNMETVPYEMCQDIPDVFL